jgi:SAM-dependent methyltransferase
MNAAAWHAHATQRIHAGDTRPAAPPNRMHWTPHPGRGPDAGLLGDLTGRRVVELGCGPGHNLAHLVSAHGATGIGVDAAPAQIHRARARYGHLPRLTFTTADAVDYLTTATIEIDVCYSVFGAVGLTPPHTLIAAVARRLQPGGRLVFSVPHPHRPGRRPGPHDPSPDTLTLPNGTHAPILRWEPDTTSWITLLRRHGLRIDTVAEPADPTTGRPSCLLVAGTRPAATREVHHDQALSPPRR